MSDVRDRDDDGSDPPVAGLLDPDDDLGDDETKELVALVGDEPDVLSAEEAAIHAVAEPDVAPDMDSEQATDAARGAASAP